MSYVIVKNADGAVVSYGPNDGMYEPTLAQGEILTIEENDIAEPLIKEYTDRLQAEAEDNALAAQTAKNALLERLGITADEAALLLG